eukprot:s1685_g25.t1
MVGPQSLLELDEDPLGPEEDDVLLLSESPDLLELSRAFGFALGFSFLLAVGFVFGSPFALPFALAFTAAGAAAEGPAAVDGPAAAASSSSASVFTSPGGGHIDWPGCTNAAKRSNTLLRLRHLVQLYA